LKRDLVVVVCVVGLVFLFVVAPFSLRAVFNGASAFNQNVSNWNTGAVTTMANSKCTLSLPLCGHGAFSCGVLLNIRQLEFHRITILTRFCSFCFCVVESVHVYLFVVCGGFGLSLFFVAPYSLLAVFFGASAFNQNLSSWNTGAVTTMQDSKCTLSPSLLATAPSVVVCC
jgi:surface protein